MEPGVPVNAVVLTASLELDDHGVLRATLECRGMGWGVVQPVPVTRIKELFETLSIRSWDRLKGSYLRLVWDEHEWVSKIGHIVDDTWMQLR